MNTRSRAPNIDRNVDKIARALLLHKLRILDRRLDTQYGTGKYVVATRSAIFPLLENAGLLFEVGTDVGM